MKYFICSIIIAICVLVACEYSYVEPPDTISDVSFKNDLLPILVLHCKSCHEVDKVFPGLILNAEMSYNQLLSDGVNAPYVNTNDPESSILYRRMNKDMPQFGLLSNDKIALFLKWIQDGAENN